MSAAPSIAPSVEPWTNVSTCLIRVMREAGDSPAEES